MIETTGEKWLEHVISFDNVLHVGRGDDMMAQMCNGIMIAYIKYGKKKKYFIRQILY